MAHAAACHTNRPIIGVLSVPVSDSRCETMQMTPRSPERPRLTDGAGGGSCFGTVYTDWLHAAGARVVPIRYDTSREEMERLFGFVNGVLFTGGGVDLSDLSAPYMRAAGHLFNLTVEANTRGDFSPLWGTCMGLQTLSILAARDPSVLTSNAFDSEDLSLPLETAEAWADSRLVAGMPPSALRTLTTENVTTNFHHDGVLPSAYEKNANLRTFFKILSTNHDRKGKPFLSTIEARKYPVYGVQWHPERNQFEFWPKNDPINHTQSAVAAMQALSSFFVSEARKSCHRFPNASAEGQALIYNYARAPLGARYQSYFFPS